jgi:hypothetical protein
LKMYCLESCLPVACWLASKARLQFDMKIILFLILYSNGIWNATELSLFFPSFQKFRGLYSTMEILKRLNGVCINNTTHHILLCHYYILPLSGLSIA